MTKNDSRRIAITLLAFAASLLIIAIAVLWSWNTLAVDLFQAPAMKFRHAVAVEFLIMAIMAVQRLTGKLKLNRSHVGHEAA